ncbi:uncharacterized protein LOC100212331 [Hydra vulgaris]|uniref:Uncharacterized protein LOC100212331 n=1 Tax=Hydra vulgaris TaxID=6087 RepID=A0ABM4CQ77_HYDVU
MKIQLAIVIFLLTAVFAKHEPNKRHKKLGKALHASKNVEKTTVKETPTQNKTKLNFEESSGDTSAQNPQDNYATPAPIGENDFEPGPVNTPVPMGQLDQTALPTPEIEQPGEVATTPNPDANSASVNLVQFNPVLTEQHSSGNGCFSTFNYYFNTASTVAERNQQYIVLRECLKGKCDISTCNDQQSKCMKVALNNENKIYECNFYWFGCANENCSPSL